RQSLSHEDEARGTRPKGNENVPRLNGVDDAGRVSCEVDCDWILRPNLRSVGYGNSGSANRFQEVVAWRRIVQQCVQVVVVHVSTSVAFYEERASTFLCFPICRRCCFMHRKSRTTSSLSPRCRSAPPSW